MSHWLVSYVYRNVGEGKTLVVHAGSVDAARITAAICAVVAR